MRKIKFLLILTLIGSAQLLFGQGSSLSSIPDNLLKNANEVVRSEDITYRVNSTREAQLIYHLTVTILNKDSKANLIYIPTSKDVKLNKVKARIYDSNGNEVRKINKNEFKDISAVSSGSLYEDDRIVYYEANYHTYPYTLVYEYELTEAGVPYALFYDWTIQGYGTSVENASFTMEVPDKIGFRYQTLNIDINPALTVVNGKQYTTWTVKNLEAITREPYSPAPSRELPMVITAPNEFQIENYRGSMTTWKDFGAFIGQLFDGRDQLPAEVVEEVKKIAASASSEKEKIHLLYRFLQENTRYVSVQLGIGGWQPFDAQYVSENKFGDCKALSNFMRAILKEAGIKSYPALIKSGDLHYEISKTFTKPKFNHVILYIPDHDYWLECTLSYFPPNYVGDSNEDRAVLLITEEGGKLHQTPDFDHHKNLEQHQVDVFLTENGSAKIHDKMLTRQSRHETYRALASRYSKNEVEEWVMENSIIPSFSIEKLDIEPDPLRPQCLVDFQADVPRYASKAGKRLFVPLNVISAMNYVPPKVEERRSEVIRKTGYTEKDSIVFHLPEGYRVESMPKEEVILKKDYAEYKLNVRLQKDKVFINRQLVLKEVELPPDAYEDFREFMKTISKHDGATMVLVERKT